MSDTSTPTSTPAVAPSTPETSVADAATTFAQAETSPEGSTEQVTDAPQVAEKELKEAIKKWKLKSQGKEREVTDEAELVRLAQLGLGAHEKFESAAKTRKEAEQILDLLQKDPAKALAAMGKDVRKLAEEYLYQEAQKELMSPEEKQKMEITQEIERLKAEKEEMLKVQREERINQLQAKYEVDIQDQIIKAIDQYKLPKNPKVVARIAEYMASALENGYEATPLDVALRVRNDLEEEHKSLFSQYQLDDLLKLLGDDRLKEIRQHEVSKIRAKAPQAPIKIDQQVTKTEVEDKPKKKQTMQEFQDDLDRLLKS